MAVETDKRDHHAVREHPNQGLLLNLEGEEINPSWIKEDQNLFIPIEPLHFEAHKLQLLLERLDKQIIHRPAQFNPQAYIAVLEKFTSICKQIKKGSAADGHEESDASGMEENGDYSPTSPLGTRDAVGVGPGVSSDNPFAR